MVVGARAARLVMELAGHPRRAALRDEEAPGHAEMHDQHLAGGEIGEEVFGAPAERDHLLALEARGEALGKGQAQIRTALLDLVEARADHRGLEAAADGLDFGEFGHGAVT